MPRKEKTRKVIYSPGYGGGWVSWFSGPREQKKFMLEYPPFVAAIEAFEEVNEGPFREPYHDPSGPVRTCAVELRRLKDGRLSLKSSSGGIHGGSIAFGGPNGEEIPAPPGGVLVWEVLEEVPAHLPVEQFLWDWVRNYGDATTPSLSGLEQLTVKKVGPDCLVRITEHDGYEKVEEGGEEWM